MNTQMQNSGGAYRRWGKRLVDITASAASLIALSPLLLLIMVASAVANCGRPFYIQKRPGKDGRPFAIIKLRTMRDAYDEHGNLLPDEERATAFGRIARRLSFDELFQLINVLKGDMSLIGPRPLLMQYLPLYSRLEGRRHEVLPGISGLAQVKGRNELSWRTKFRYDIFYVDHVSLEFDALLCWLTVKKVIKADDVSASGKTVEECVFRGH